ncbi:phosphate ABC transporter substrate-binding protein [Spirulina sp. CS-785/01]|uniref:phosphate ABC transporter substrate-binding protein n=1 Tax=Spirulina sp. CS-785/01 TaxID=3021716 RepID=UPI00232AD7AD|nr:phosphate ABC transporter substrate-binding protein [Spirulina sp. CS-785/01]MDB9314273.1 phosphate ABC transporter substrate-binding protein [Spirulina sp. CS-785/01]
MSQKKDTLALVIALIITLGIIGGALFFFRGILFGGNTPQTAQNPSSGQGQNTDQTPFSVPSSLPQGTTININGSTSMVLINEALKTGFEQKFPGTTVNTQAAGTSNGIQAVISGSADIAAASRPLTAEEKQQGLTALRVSQDKIALTVSVNNPFQRGLTPQQVVKIFTGEITDWSAVGGPQGVIQVINRPPVSGTRQAFQELVLQGQAFGTTPNIQTMERDATTPMLQRLGDDGIGYATYSQVADQNTVRVVPIDGVTPEASSYPYQRPLFYVYQEATEGVQAFLGYATSLEGQGAIVTANQ